MASSRRFLHAKAQSREAPIIAARIKWYSEKSTWNQEWFRKLKVAEIIAAALVPFAAGKVAPPIITGLLGVIVVVLEALLAERIEALISTENAKGISDKEQAGKASRPACSSEGDQLLRNMRRSPF